MLSCVDARTRMEGGDWVGLVPSGVARGDQVVVLRGAHGAPAALPVLVDFGKLLVEELGLLPQQLRVGDRVLDSLSALLGRAFGPGQLAVFVPALVQGSCRCHTPPYFIVHRVDDRVVDGANRQDDIHPLAAPVHEQLEPPVVGVQVPALALIGREAIDHVLDIRLALNMGGIFLTGIHQRGPAAQAPEIGGGDLKIKSWRPALMHGLEHALR